MPTQTFMLGGCSKKKLQHMSTEHIYNPEEGISKIKELAEGIDFCFFCTDLKNDFNDSGPMSVQEVNLRLTKS